LSSIPAGIASLVHLEHLDLSSNPLKLKEANDPSCLPYEMRYLKALSWLSLCECSLHQIPTAVWLCTPLRHLDISRNKIGILVGDIGNLQNLRSLNASSCNLTCLPDEIGFCGDLQDISLMSNPMETLPDSLKECTHLNNLRISFKHFSTLIDTYMENLISKGQIKSEHIPSVVFELEQLVELDLKSSKINTLPENNLINLQSIYLDYNYFEKFQPNSFEIFQNLKVLTISHNLLKEIPNEICSLKELFILNLSNNCIKELPSQFNLPKLTELYLSNNCLKYINSSIASLKSLKRLALDKNEICEISDHLFELKRLEYLDLSKNRITELSPRLQQLECIKYSHSFEKLNKIGLWLVENPLEVPPKQCWLTTNIEKIYEFLFNYEQKKIDDVYYCRLVFMGESGCGKSLLIDCLNDGANLKDTKHNKTTIDIKQSK
jgi:Leucine-rich repeat (LRR) protein